jgi:hypothetical protein
VGAPAAEDFAIGWPVLGSRAPVDEGKAVAMPHLKCEACRLRAWRVGDTDEDIDARCPSCAAPLERVPRLESIVGFQSIELDDGAPILGLEQAEMRLDPLS